MSAPARAPSTIKELQSALRLKHRSDVEALTKSDYVKETFRMYANRCLSSGAIKKELPDWKDVDEYLLEKQTSWSVRSNSQSLEQAVTEESYNNPYDLLSHAALFALRMMTFLRGKGKKYDVSLDYATCPEDVLFDRYMRILNLLGFMVSQNREMKSRTESNRGSIVEWNWI